ncbi:hypothetical protein [Labrys wisconsinensis]|uniref:Uncharacterized protein n=1 Tax=Labrys wisconsinensis TaxID=425677 RepID=A0ABU0J8U1_9HYPH|nr:hypothetical protein [Labrys wisconsinensis]MDQ0470688.1 hypothetical protein [Labrys wisconsinensis]
MSEYHNPRTPSHQRSGAREQLERLYREIGIPAVAAAAAQVARKEKTVEKPRHELPFCLRDDSQAA